MSFCHDQLKYCYLMNVAVLQTDPICAILFKSSYSIVQKSHEISTMGTVSVANGS